MKVLSLFSGIGSFEKSLERLNIDHKIVGFSEIDKWAIESYCKIHDVDESLNFGDVSTIESDELPDADLITYGFPCQDISVAGLGKGINEETRSGLLYEAERIIEHIKPKYAIAENVKNLVGKRFKQDFDELLERLEGYGYNNYWKVLNAKHFGVPQNRERVFIISIRKDVDKGDFEFPEELKATLTVGDLLESHVDEKYNLTVDRIRRIGNWKSYQNPLDRIIGKNSISPTLTARGAGEYHAGAIVLGDVCVNTNIREDVTTSPQDTYDKYNLRMMTPREAFRFMGFDDKDYDNISHHILEREQYRQAGNSIVVNVLDGIFRNLLGDGAKEGI